MFVLLEHDTTQAAGVPPAERAVHWDLLIEAAGCERLRTWRLAANPLQTAGDIPARPLPDHRRAYLDFEGAVSGERGHVRRLARGAAAIEEFTPARTVFTLDSPLLRGRYEIVGETADSGSLRCLSHSGASGGGPGGCPGGRTQT